ncbi:MAG: hypothetical protein HUU50_16965 [Candidatus Brocadiae bacterium]|nr:hypothetical protein [Candidatus Brocadiia bacterium]
MKINIQKLPLEIQDRLREIQKNPKNYSGFYVKHRNVGLSIFGLILFFGACIGGIGLAQEEQLSYLIWFGCAFVASWIAIASYYYLKDYKASEIKPYIFLNPMYLIKVGLRDVIYHNLWTEKKDLKIVHNYTNGIYSGTAFTFYFQDGSSESFNVSPKKEADRLIDLINTYRLNFIDALEKQNFEPLFAFDLFYEMSDPKNKEKLDETLYPSQNARSKWSVFFQIGMAASILACFFYYYNLYYKQKKDLRYCYSAENYERFLERYSLNFFKAEAEEKLYSHYKKEFDTNKANIQNLKKLAQKKHFPFLSPAKQQEIATLYSEETKKQIDALYKDCVEQYQSSSQAPAKEAIIKILEFARQNKSCPVSIEYSWAMEGLEGPFPIVTTLGQQQNAQAPSVYFSAAKNDSNQLLLDPKLKEVISSAIPYGIAEVQTKGDIVIKVSANILPSTYSYEFTLSPSFTKSYFQGIEYQWSIQIFLQEEKLFEFFCTTLPPMNIKINYTTYKYQTSYISPDSVYGKMVESIFADFTQKVSEQLK